MIVFEFEFGDAALAGAGPRFAAAVLVVLDLGDRPRSGGRSPGFAATIVVVCVVGARPRFAGGVAAAVMLELRDSTSPAWALPDAAVPIAIVHDGTRDATRAG